MVSKIILIVGSNPSQQSKSYSAFANDSKSRSTLDKWFSFINTDSTYSIMFTNVYDRPTSNNRALSKYEIKSHLPKLHDYIVESNPDYIIALGNTADIALTLLRLSFYKMPHPSGLNRQLNDPLYIQEKIKGLRQFLGLDIKD